MRRGGVAADCTNSGLTLIGDQDDVVTSVTWVDKALEGFARAG